MRNSISKEQLKVTFMIDVGYMFTLNSYLPLLTPYFVECAGKRQNM